MVSFFLNRNGRAPTACVIQTPRGSRMTDQLPAISAGITDPRDGPTHGDCARIRLLI